MLGLPSFPRERRTAPARARGGSVALAVVLLLAGTDFAAAAIVENLSVKDAANAADWSVQSGLASGNAQYGDRAYALNAVPGLVAGSDWIRTANDSKAFTGATLVTFTVSADADVYVATNDSIGTKPS